MIFADDMNDLVVFETWKEWSNESFIVLEYNYSEFLEDVAQLDDLFLRLFLHNVQRIQFFLLRIEVVLDDLLENIGQTTVVDLVNVSVVK